MTSTSGRGLDDGENHGLELLGEVNLKDFQAAPQALQPFQSSILHWQVEAPQGVHIELDGTAVSKSGTKPVQPTATRTFRLNAHAGSHTRFLGSVTVSVNLNQCTTLVSTMIDEIIRGKLIEAVAANSEIYFRLTTEEDSEGRTQWVQSKPVVTMSPGRIHFRLYLKGRAENFPDPDIDVDAGFGLGLAPSPATSTSAGSFPKTEIVPTAIDVSVNVSFPYWAYLIAGVNLTLQSRAEMAEDRVRAAFTSGIGTLAAKINAFFEKEEQVRIAEPQDSEKHQVRIYVSEYGGTVEVDYCPVPQPGVTDT